MVETILNGLLPVAFVVALGWLSGKLRILQHDDAGVIATYVIRFALPFALFDGARRTAPSDLLNYGLLGALTVGICGTFLIAALVGRFAFRHDIRTAAIQALVCSFPDMAYFAAPVLAALFGPAGFLAVLLGNLVVMLVILPATIILTHCTRDSVAETRLSIILGSLRSAITNPIVWLPLLGVTLSLLHHALPPSLGLSAETVAKSAGGTSLFALGLMLYGEPVRINANVLTNLGLKNILQPALMVVAALLLGLPAASTQQALLTGAAPSATASSIFALKSGTYTADAASTVFLSTLLSIFTAALLIALVHG